MNLNPVRQSKQIEPGIDFRNAFEHRSFRFIRYFVLFVASGMVTTVYSQKTDSASVFVYPINLDSFTIKSDFDVNGFIRRVRADTTFYKSFLGMNLAPYVADNNIEVFNKNGDEIAFMHSKTRNIVKNGCWQTKVFEQRYSPNFYSRDLKYNYYTAELYDYLFFSVEPVCDQNDLVKDRKEEYGKGIMERSEYELKQLIFNPGSRITGIPLMGKKAEIFENDREKNFDLKIYQDTIGNEMCYVLKITPKTGYKNKAVYKELTTWFRKSDYAIVARDYSLSLNTHLYDFDVHMKVRTAQIGQKLYPTSIDYDGNWHVTGKKREKVKFTTTFVY